MNARKRNRGKDKARSQEKPKALGKRSAGSKTRRIAPLDFTIPRGVDHARAELVASSVFREIALCFDSQHPNHFEVLFPEGSKRDPEGITLDLTRPWFGMVDCPWDYPQATTEPLCIGLREELSWATEEPYWRRGLQILLGEGKLQIHGRTGDLLIVSPAVAEKPSGPERTDKKFTHSDDFRSVNWFGREYQFTALQASVVKALVQAWQNRTPGLSQETILEKAGSAGSRLADIFRNHRAGKTRYHSAWGTMIVQGTSRGSYLLAAAKAPPRS